MGKELTSKQAFILATAADVYALMTLKMKLEDIDIKHNSPTGALAHCIGGVLQNIVDCNSTNIGVIIKNVHDYAELRFGILDNKVSPDLRATPLVNQLLTTLRTEQKICIAVAELKKVPEPA